jgi:hypothetical protein
VSRARHRVDSCAHYTHQERLRVGRGSVERDDDRERVWARLDVVLNEAALADASDADQGQVTLELARPGGSGKAVDPIELRAAIDEGHLNESIITDLK